MPKQSSSTTASTASLILVPALITLAVTILRLIGELQHWPTALFKPSAGGFGSLIGITWLAPIFGIYFGLKLAETGQRPSSRGGSVGWSIAGLVVMFTGATVGFGLKADFPGKAIIGLVLVLGGTALAFFAWGRLGRVLLAYALAARLPVLIVMFLAMKGDWHTHYDVAPPGFPEMELWSKYVALAILPQVFFWIPFTIVTGTLCGSIVAAARGSKPAHTVPDAAESAT